MLERYIDAQASVAVPNTAGRYWINTEGDITVGYDSAKSFMNGNKHWLVLEIEGNSYSVLRTHRFYPNTGHCWTYIISKVRAVILQIPF